MYRTHPVIWNDDIKAGINKLEQDLNKFNEEGFALSDVVSLGKIGCVLILFNPGNDGYGDPEPLTTDPDKIPTEQESVDGAVTPPTP